MISEQSFDPMDHDMPARHVVPHPAPASRHDPLASSGGAPVPSYLVGQDAEGHWLAVEEHGLGGGIFVSKDAALRYVRFETSRMPGACHLASEPVGLWLDEAPLVRQAA